jgi:hypothetical protein
MSAALAKGTVVHEGELMVIGVVSRSPAGRGEAISVTGGQTRVIALAAGGNVLFDNMTDGALRGIGSSGARRNVELPAKTERVVIAPVGPSIGIGGSLDGWYAGQSLPLIGWGMAAGAGVVVTFAQHRAAPNRERHDGGWANTRDLLAAATVTTRFDAPVRAVAIAVDEASGAGDPARDLQMRLVGARRSTAADGTPLPPQALVEGVRTILVFQIEPQPDEGTLDPHVLVSVDGTRGGQLSGVAGTPEGAAALLTALTAGGFNAAIAPPLRPGTGSRTIAWRSAAEPDLRRAERDRAAAQRTAQRARPRRRTGRG